MIEPVVKTVRVPVGARTAFERFTKEIGRWWPRATHSVGQEDCESVHWDGPEGAELYEVMENGERSVWGTFTEWDPPNAFAMTWHPGRGPEAAQEVRVTFTEENGETVVTLRHSGFEALGDSAPDTRDRYDGGWQSVLQLMVDDLQEAGES